MNAQAVRAPPKNPMSAASKITKVVTDFFLPMADGFVPAYTPLTQSPDAEEMLLLEQIWDMFPEAMRTREDFVDRMGALYDTGRQQPRAGDKRAMGGGAFEDACACHATNEDVQPFKASSS
jgi:hypothetical protein